MSLDNLPGDPMMLLSFVNTRLRDGNISLEDFSNEFGVCCKEIKEKLSKIGYEYNEELNKFI